jgi:hypothetical protein
MSRTLVLLVLLCGCSQDKTTPAATAVPSAAGSLAPTASATSTLAMTARYKNEAIPLTSALAFSRGGAALQLTLSTHELTCAHLREKVTRHPDEVSFDLTLAPLLAPDGAERWSLTRARFGIVTREGDLGAVTIDTYNPHEDVTLPFDHTLHFPPDQLVLKGPLTAKGCGVLPWSGEAEVRRQNRLEVSLGGKALTMNGATSRRQTDGETLRISSEPHPCGSVVGSDLALTLKLSERGVVSLRAEGYVLPRALFSELGPGAIAITRHGDDSELAGRVDLGGYALELAGTVSPRACD